MPRVTSSGWYCPDCGTKYWHLPEGFVTCAGCGGIGLRGFEGHLRPAKCSEHPSWQGWDDGGVNDDLGAHRRREHAIAEASRG
jgi:hypothetical protein